MTLTHLNCPHLQQRVVNAQNIQGAPEPIVAGAVGKTFLPASYTESQAVYQRNHRHACATLSHMGPPTFFITMTANQLSPQLQGPLDGLEWMHRPDLVQCVFELKG